MPVAEGSGKAAGAPPFMPASAIANLQSAIANLQCAFSRSFSSS